VRDEQHRATGEHRAQRLEEPRRGPRVERRGRLAEAREDAARRERAAIRACARDYDARETIRALMEETGSTAAALRRATAQ